MLNIHFYGKRSIHCQTVCVHQAWNSFINQSQLSSIHFFERFLEKVNPNQDERTNTVMLVSSSHSVRPQQPSWNPSENFIFCNFFIWFARTWAADHENLVHIASTTQCISRFCKQQDQIFDLILFFMASSKTLRINVFSFPFCSEKSRIY